MNTPFSQPNLANFIKTGTDAVVSKVTFPDGTSQATAATAADETKISNGTSKMEIASSAGACVFTPAGLTGKTTTFPVSGGITTNNITFPDGTSQTTAATTAATFSFKQYDDDDQAYTVATGNASDTDPNNKGGLIDPELVALVTTVGGDYEGVSLDFSVVGEWAAQEENKGVAIARAKFTNGSYVYDKILRAAYPGNSNVRFISPFTLSFYSVNRDTTLECCNGKYIDTDIADNTLYSYTVLLVNSAGSTSFKLNKVVGSGGEAAAERGVSSITAQLFT